MRIPVLLAAQIQSSLKSSSSSSEIGQSLSISGPSTLRSCIPSTFNWTPTSSPYILSLIQHPLTSSTDSENQIVEEEEEEMIIVTETKATWMTDIKPGSNITLKVVDSKGNEATTLNWIVEEGTTGCLDDLN
ncbi:uncharacterized protein L201_004342 [Kwoniella dendrophila CBS 6074]|uniref:Uncharacterized protein n=1 Tax=Kwoniella dendrophila CBS 6074 TaxID=1295534 RepID=A0AAX4JWZ1_9TREE